MDGGLHAEEADGGRRKKSAPVVHVESRHFPCPSLTTYWSVAARTTSACIFSLCFVFAQSGEPLLR